MKKFLSIMMAFFFAISLSACFTTSDDSETNSGKGGSTSSRYEFIGELDMTVDYESYLGYSVKIRGKLKNTSKKEFSYVSVTFAIYDEEGNQMETALDNMNYLQPGEIWSFEANMIGWTDEQPMSCKLVDVKAF